MRKALTLLLGICLVAGPLAGRVRAVDDEYDDDDLEDEAFALHGADEEHVVALTNANFDSMLAKHQFALKLAPEYEAAAATLAEEESEVLIAKVDATEETELAERFGVQGYPTLKWFVNGQDTDYNGGRDEEAILKWVAKKTGPPAVTVATASDLSAQEKLNDVIVVGYFSSFDEKDASFQTFLTTAAEEEGVTFVQTKSADVAKAAGLSKAGSVAIVQNFEGEARSVVPFTGAMEQEALEAFILAEKLPLLLEFSTDNTDRIFNSGITRHLIYVAPAADLKASAPGISALKEVAAALKGQFVCVTVNADSEEGEPVISFFDMDVSTLPTLVAFEIEPQQRKFRYEGEMKSDAIKAFADGVLAGTVHPIYKSEAIPADDMDGHVKIVVGKSFDSVVKDSNKDVLLEVYAPWCGHCKQLAPIYKKLAKRFRDIPSVVIAKMDGTTNEHPELEVEGFPTLLFYPAAEGAEAVPYEGERTLKGMTKFIKEHAIVPYQLKKKKEGAEDGGDGDVKDEL